MSGWRQRARRVLGGVALAGATGCLILQDPPYFEGQVEFRNRPPRIREEAPLTPEGRVVRTGNGPDCSLTFRVAVEDPDLDDPLFVEWYVDYDTDINPSPDRRATLQGGTSLTRSAEYVYDFGRAGANPLATPGSHLVEVVVYDSTPLENRTALERGRIALPDGGSEPDLGYAVSYAWFVQVETGECP